MAALPFALVAQDQTSQGISGELFQLRNNQAHIWGRKKRLPFFFLFKHKALMLLEFLSSWEREKPLLIGTGYAQCLSV